MSGNFQPLSEASFDKFTDFVNQIMAIRPVKEVTVESEYGANVALVSDVVTEDGAYHGGMYVFATVVKKQLADVEPGFWTTGKLVQNGRAYTLEAVEDIPKAIVDGVNAADDIPEGEPF